MNVSQGSVRVFTSSASMVTRGSISTNVCYNHIVTKRIITICCNNTFNFFLILGERCIKLKLLNMCNLSIIYYD